MRRTAGEDRTTREAGTKRRTGRIVFIRDGAYVRRPPKPRRREETATPR